MKEMSKGIKSGINIGILVITLIVNTLGGIGLINGYSQKEVSDMYSTLITPAPIIFSIWSVIYGLLIASMIALFIKRKEDHYGKVIDEISVLFWISSVLNIGWIISFSYLQIELSVIFIIGLLVVLFMILNKLMAIKEKGKNLLSISFGLYTGWMFFAVVLNITLLLVKLNWNGFGVEENLWGIGVLALAVLLVIAAGAKIKSISFFLPGAWAYFGIFLEVSGKNNSGDYNSILATALLSSITLLIGAGIVFYRNRYKEEKPDKLKK